MTTISVTPAPQPQGADPAGELAALQAIITVLQPFPPEVVRRIYQSAATFLKLGPVAEAAPPASGHSGSTRLTGVARPYSDDRSMSPKDFLLEKQPRSDVERIACLAFYLTHFRDTPHFKTLDLSKLNTEAAQPKFANAANSTNNAVKRGYLAQAAKAQKQLSAAGEQFVRALPDRDAAKATMANLRLRRRAKRLTSAKVSSQE